MSREENLMGQNALGQGKLGALTRGAETEDVHGPRRTFGVHFFEREAREIRRDTCRGWVVRTWIWPCRDSLFENPHPLILRRESVELSFSFPLHFPIIIQATYWPIPSPELPCSFEELS